MMKEYQVTLVCATGSYKPVSAIVKVEADNREKLGDADFIADIRTRGIIKICQKRYWTKADLTKYAYTRVKIREFDKERIAKENAERYEEIKRERG